LVNQVVGKVKVGEGELGNICKENLGDLKKITVHGGQGILFEYCLVFLQPTPVFN